MSDLGKFEIFSSEHLGKVRAAFSSDGEAWFVAKDVCDVLGINNSRQALSRLMADEKNTVILNDGIRKRGNPNVSIVSESGLYSIIMSARKKEAVEFQRWVTREVLPSLRKHGAYVMGQEEMTDSVKLEMYSIIENLARKKAAYEKDSNYWFNCYEKLLQEYNELSDALVKAGKLIRRSDTKTLPVAKECVILDNGNGKRICVDSQGFIQNLSEGALYSVDRD